MWVPSHFCLTLFVLLVLGLVCKCSVLACSSAQVDNETPPPWRTSYVVSIAFERVLSVHCVSDMLAGGADFDKKVPKVTTKVSGEAANALAEFSKSVEQVDEMSSPAESLAFLWRHLFGGHEVASWSGTSGCRGSDWRVLWTLEPNMTL